MYLYIFAAPSVPGGRYGRRHSYTPKLPPPDVRLPRDMSRLSVAGGAGHSAGRGGVSPRTSTKRRASSVRRSSRSGKMITTKALTWLHTTMFLKYHYFCGDISVIYFFRIFSVSGPCDSSMRNGTSKPS